MKICTIKRIDSNWLLKPKHLSSKQMFRFQLYVTLIQLNFLNIKTESMNQNPNY